jgi:hypothetical protein
MVFSGGYSKMLRKPLRELFLFIIMTAVMAVVYDMIWRVRPDYFRLQEGLNVLPLELERISEAYSAYSNKDPLPVLRENSGAQVAAKKIESIYREFQSASVMLIADSAELKRQEQRDQSEYQKFAETQWEQYNQYIAEKTAPAAARSSAIKTRMDGMLAAFHAKSEDDLPSGPIAVEHAQLGVQFAQAEADRAKAEYEARDYGLRHLTEFQGKPTQQEYLAKSKALDDLRQKVYADQLAADKLHADIYQAFVDYRDADYERLGYWDFLYFSVGAATTATFGDIAPNSTIIRMLVCLQVLVSIGLTGLVISGLSSSRNTTPTTE